MMDNKLVFQELRPVIAELTGPLTDVLQPYHSAILWDTIFSTDAYAATETNTG